MAISIPVPKAKPFPRFPVLSTRQESFCRGFVATGNAAEAARRAGYAEGSARQTGHALMERPHIVERVRRIRLLWRETARQETQILLDRLEQAWAVAVAKGSPFMMLQVIRLQADLSGLSRRGLHRRADLWPLPDEDEFGELAAALEAAEDALESGADVAAQPGPLAAARHRRNGAAGAETAPEDGPAETGRRRTGRRTGGPRTSPRTTRRSTTIRRRPTTTRPARCRANRPRPPEGRRRRHRRQRERLDVRAALRPRPDRSLDRGRLGVADGKRGPPRRQSVRDRLPGHGAGRSGGAEAHDGT